MNIKKLFLITVAVVIILVAAFYAFNSYIYEQKQAPAAADYKKAEYMIDGQRVKLGDTTRYFGNEVMTDLNDDGLQDVVFLVTHQPGGSGTFYYVVAALQKNIAMKQGDTDIRYVGSEGLLLGDRIAPQTTEKGKGKIVIVNYADRKPGEPFTTEPSVGKSIWLLLDPASMQFGEVAQDFEGEANPAIMKLDMKKWTWISALYNDGREIKPATAGAFTLTFAKDGTFSATTDCNSMSGMYAATTNTISFSKIAATEMYCEASQGSDFVTFLQNASGYHFTSKGELILDLKLDSGSVVFK